MFLADSILRNAVKDTKKTGQSFRFLASAWPSHWGHLGNKPAVGAFPLPLSFSAALTFKSMNKHVF